MHLFQINLFERDIPEITETPSLTNILRQLGSGNLMIDNMRKVPSVGDLPCSLHRGEVSIAGELMRLMNVCVVT